MQDIVEIEEKGNAAVKELRLKKLQSGHPFMINSKDLPSNQCYLEYPDGSIQLVTIQKAARDFTIIKTLSQEEINIIRLKYNLSAL